MLIGEYRQWLSSPSAFDLSLVREFYTDYSEAAVLLGDTECADACRDVLSHLADPVISSDGVLQEWTENHIEGEIGHRHRSPFVSFCPGSLYSKESHPDMAAAMEKLLRKRFAAGNGMSTSFSYVWDAQILARLGSGTEAYDMLETLLRIHALDNMMMTTNDYAQKNGGIAWFTGTKVVQIEAELALSAALSELLYQDQQNLIRLLPALPDNFPDGRLDGIHGRRGVVCSLAWTDGHLTEFAIRVQQSGVYRILPPAGTQFVLCDDEGHPAECAVEDGTYAFSGQAGKEYWFTSV